MEALTRLWCVAVTGAGGLRIRDGCVTAVGGDGEKAFPAPVGLLLVVVVVVVTMLGFLTNTNPLEVAAAWPGLGPDPGVLTDGDWGREHTV